ncbi:hypothetical protein M3Y99_01159700 [Aphelenchoides fujianensis]|nr:hypothetical protein M3Y99_01159700 [Aphelenchoides fujianensis]
MIQKVFICNSVLHLPTDDDCLLSTADLKRTTHEKTDETYPPNNYYENLWSVFAEAKFNGYKGGEGILRVAQKPGTSAKALLVIDGIPANQPIEVLATTRPMSRCYKLRREEVWSSAKRLAAFYSDPSGMGVVPWEEVDLDVVDGRDLEATILIVHNNEVLDCGELEKVDGETVANSAHTAVLTSALLLSLALYILSTN